LFTVSKNLIWFVRKVIPSIIKTSAYNWIQYLHGWFQIQWKGLGSSAQFNSMMGDKPQELTALLMRHIRFWVKQKACYQLMWWPTGERPQICALKCRQKPQKQSLVNCGKVFIICHTDDIMRVEKGATAIKSNFNWI